MTSLDGDWTDGPPIADLAADAPAAVLRMKDGRWVCTEVSPAWRELPSVPGGLAVGDPIGALLMDRFVAEGLGRLCDLAALTSTVRTAPARLDPDGTLTAVAVPQPPAADDPAPRVRVVLAPPSPLSRVLEEAGEPAGRELVAVFDEDLRVVEVNDEVLEVSGLDRRSIIGRTNLEMGYPASIAHLWDEQHRRVLRTGRPARLTYDLPTVLGTRRYESDVLPLRDAQGAVGRVEVRSRDVSGERLDEVRQASLVSFGHGASSVMWTQLRSERGAAAGARRAVRRWLAQQGPPQPPRFAELIVSELVTNAAMHARTDLCVQVERSEDVLRIEVHDADPTLPELRGAETHGGRGLALVEMVSTRWGADRTPAGKVVWADIPWRSAESARAGSSEGQAESTGRAGAPTS